MLSTDNIVEHIYIQWILNNKFSYKKKMKIRENILYYELYNICIYCINN